MSMDYYEVLEVSRSATAKEIKTSYRKLAMQFHPDRNAGDESAAEKFKEINEAYAVLSDDQKRAHYDRFGKTGGSTQVTGDIFDIFNSVFGNAGFRGAGASGFGGAQAAQGFHGEDLESELQITLEQARKGETVQVSIQRMEVCEHCDGQRAEPGKDAKITCTTCGGAGQVRQQAQSLFGTMITNRICPECQGSGDIIVNPCTVCNAKGRKKVKRDVDVSLPKGIDSGYRLRIPQQGNMGIQGGQAGDLYVYIETKAHEHFSRDGDDLHYNLDIGVAQAILGSAFEVPTMEGPEVLTIPAGTQPNTQFRLRGQGMPRLQRIGMGDLVITANVVIPKQLSPKAKEALESYAQEQNEVIHEKEGLLERVKGLFKKH